MMFEGAMSAIACSGQGKPMRTNDVLIWVHRFATREASVPVSDSYTF
jgi:hypothetical protein